MKIKGEEVKFVGLDDIDMADAVICSLASGPCYFDDDQFGVCSKCPNEIKFRPIPGYEGKTKICLPCFLKMAAH